MKEIHNKMSPTMQMQRLNVPHNIIPPEENTIQQPNDIYENELLKIKETVANAYAESIITPFNKRFNLRKLGRKTVKNLEKNLEKVKQVIEATPLLLHYKSEATR